MQILRRAATAGGRPQQLPRRESWSHLSAFVRSSADQRNWSALRAAESKAAQVISRFGGARPSAAGSTTAAVEINWKDWGERIQNKQLLACMKEGYDHQIKLLGEAGVDDHSAAVEGQAVGWELYEGAKQSCRESVRQSEALVANGARSLWLSARSPPVWRVDDNEWLDSDDYWQAYIEKHHHYNPSQLADDPELPAEQEAVKASWHRRMARFNDRSDTPMLYSHMEHLPSWEYYDIHRRAFLEHMLYFLLRTGHSHHFFPEVPPWKWLCRIEDHRHHFLSVTQRRRGAKQLQKLERERALDLQPIDYGHGGEDFHLKLLQREAATYEAMVARLMGNYIFLCHPFIPVQSRSALLRAAKTDGGKGRLFTIGRDVNALFYLPDGVAAGPLGREDETAAAAPPSPPRPRQAFNSLLDHLCLTGRRFNPAYAALLDIQTATLEERGENWLTAPGESVARSFLRRLRDDDPAHAVYTQYVEELEDRFRSKRTEVEDVMQAIEEVEKRYLEEVEAAEWLAHANNVDVAAEGRQEHLKLEERRKAGALPSQLEGGFLTVVNRQTGEVLKDTDALFRELTEAESQKESYADAVRSQKVMIGGVSSS